MKTLVAFALLLGTTLFSFSSTPQSNGQAQRIVIGLSPFLRKEVKDDVYRGIVRLVIEDLPLGTSIWIYDAYHLRTITQLEIPNVHAFQSSKTRANQFTRHIRDLKEFLARENEKPVLARLMFTDAVRVPQFLEFVASNFRPESSDRPLNVVVLGSPLYLDHKEPGFSMIDGYFPSDGHLSAARDKSIFSLESRNAALQKVAVHFGYFGDPWVTEVHKDKVTRFWTLFLQGQGARLATFTGDLPTLFEGAKNPSRSEAPSRVAIDPAQTKLEMLRVIRDVGTSDWITRDALQGATVPPTHTVGPMKIGIRWKGRVDLDLYARGARDSEMLFFEQTRSAEGYYFKDHRSSPDREYEFIEFESPIDVWKAEARVNFYEGQISPGPRGEIRIEFDGKIYTGAFIVPAREGNEGRAGARQRAHWSEIDIPALLKLR